MGNPHERDPAMQPPAFPLDDDNDVNAGVDDNEEMNDTDDENADTTQSRPQHRPSQPRQHDGGPDDDDDDDRNGLLSDADEDDDPHPPPLVSSGDLRLPRTPSPQLQQPSLSLGQDDDIDQLADGDDNGPLPGNQLHLQGPALPRPASPVLSPSPVPAAIPRSSLEPDDPLVPSWQRIVSGFLPYATEQVNRHLVDKLSPACTPIFPLLGCRWQIDLYANRVADHAVGIFLKYIGCPGRPSWELSPPVVFRIVVFHKDVIAETDAINAERKAQHDAQVAAQADAAASSSAEAVPAPPRDFVPLPYPANDPRNVEDSRTFPLAFRPDQDCGFTDLVPHKRLSQFCTPAPANSLIFRVLIQRPPEHAGRAIRTLKSFIDEEQRTDANEQGKIRWPYLGLNNQGATCYMNSYLQALFYLPAFRRAVYSLPVEASQLLELLEPSASSSAVVTTKDIPLALQHLFYTLDKSDKACCTKKLTQSFGWTAADSFQQHDVQEFSRVLLDHLESVTKDHPTLAPITRLFEGKQQMFIECTSVPYSSTRIETFLDLSLNVKGMGTLQRSFEDYVAEESMEGANQYRAVDASRGIDFGMQNARKGVRFIRFPSLLQLQLKRYEMSMIDGSMKKVNERLDFPLVLDLTHLEFGESEEEEKKQTSPSPDPAALAAAAAAAASSSSASGAASPKPTRVRLPSNPLDPAIYHLQSVLVHRGSLGGGHYFAFARPFLASLQQRARELKQSPSITITDLDELSAEYEHSPFFKFDDETVSICKDAKAATEMNFGGTYTELVQQLGKRMEISSPESGNAYMLVYVRRSIVWNAGFATDATNAAPVHNGAANSSSAAAAMSDAPAASSASASAVAAADESKNDPDLTQPQGDAAMSNTAPPSAPSLQRASSMRFTETPQSLRDFVASLAPVSVPFPEHIERGIDEAKTLRRQREEELLVKAQQFPLDVIFERDVLWQGLRDDETEAYRPEGGVAGLDFTVAPPVTDRDAPVPLRQFLFKQPIQSLVLQKPDPLSKVRAELADKYGVPAERLQLWRVTKATTTTLAGMPAPMRRGHLEFLSDLQRPLSSLLSLGADAFAAQSTPLIFVRDTLPIDSHPALGRLTSEAGNPHNYARSVDPKYDAQAGQAVRQVLLFKFWDHVTQRLVYLGSATLFKHMSVGELHTFARGLLRSKGVRRPTVEVAPTLVSSFAQMQAVASPGAPDAADAMSDAGSASSSGPLAFVARMLALPSAAISAAAGPSAPPDVEVIASNVQPEMSSYELHWDDVRKRMAPEQLAALTTSQSIEAACVQHWPLDTPLHLVEEFDALHPAPIAAPQSLLTTAYKMPGSLRSKEEPPKASLSVDLHLSLRDCKLQNGSVIVISTPLTQHDMVWLQRKHAQDLEANQRHLNPMQPAAAAAPMVLGVPSRSPKKASKRAAAGSELMSDAAASSSSSSVAACVSLLPPPPSVGCMSPLPLGTLSTLPVAPAFHADSSSYLRYLQHRFVVEWKPALLDMATMQTDALDPAVVPAHPFAQPSVQSFVMEVSDADTIEALHAIVQAQVASLLPASVSSLYPQLSNPQCYRLWRSSSVTPRPLVKHGDLRSQESDRPIVAHALLPITVKANASTACVLLEQNHWRLRAAVHPFFFELSPVPISDLRDNWWFRLEFVDVRGQVLTVPSSCPALLDSDPLLLPKHLDFSPGLLKDRIYRRFIKPHAARFLEHMPPVRFYEEAEADKAAAAAAAAEAEAKAKLQLQIKEETDDAAVDVKSEASGEMDIAAAVHLAAAAQKQQQAGKRRFEDEDQPGQSASSPIKTEPDSKKQRGSASTDIASSAPSLALCAPVVSVPPAPVVDWRVPRLFQYDPRGLNVSASSAPFARFFLEWSLPAHYTNQLQPQVMRRMQAALKAIQERQSHSACPARYLDTIAAADYTHPLPFKLSVYLPRPESRVTFVYRFTTFTSAESGPAPKASYAFSPLPPIMLLGSDADFASAAAVRALLAKQIDVQEPASLRLAVLRPREYELIPSAELTTSVSAAASAVASPSVSVGPVPAPSVFAAWHAAQLANENHVVLGLFDDSTKHVLSTSHTHEVATTGTAWIKARSKHAGLSINGAK